MIVVSYIFFFFFVEFVTVSFLFSFVLCSYWSSLFLKLFVLQAAFCLKSSFFFFRVIANKNMLTGNACKRAVVVGK